MIIYPGAGYENEATGDMALLGHEAELHYHSGLVPGHLFILVIESQFIS